MFKRKKMSEKDFIDELLDGDESFRVPINDKRRFNADGERIADEPEPQKGEPVKPQRERELEEKLKAETERRSEGDRAASSGRSRGTADHAPDVAAG